MSQASTDTGWGRLEEARTFIDQRQFEKAQSALAAAARGAGIDADLFLAIGDGYGKIGEREQARLYWRAAVTRADAAGVRSKANRRLASDALRRDRPGEAIGYLQRYVEDRPDDRGNLLRLLSLRLTGQHGAARAALLDEFQQAYPVLRDEILNAALVHPFTEPEKAASLLEERFEDLLRQGDLALQAVDTFIDASQPAHALTLAQRIFAAEGAAQRELSCILRAEKAAGRDPAASLGHFEEHLARHPGDHGNRVKKAKLLFQLRRWHKVCEETGAVMAAEPHHIPAAELAIKAFVRLDRPGDARALRDKVVALHDIGRPETAKAIVALDLAMADGASALERQGEMDDVPQSDAASTRIDVLMAVGQYDRALEAIGAAMGRSDDMQLRARGIQCASSLRSWPEPGAAFPEGAFRAGIGRRRTRTGPGRSVVLVTSTLGAGGAERQIAMTASRIAAPLLEVGLSTQLVCRDLRPEYSNHLMLPMLEGSATEVTDLAHADGGLVARDLRARGELTAEDIRLLSAFPLPLYRTIALLYDRFRALQPEVVHLWQDGIIAAGGVAAMMAGVPRVVCSIRNVVPLESDTRRARPYLQAVYRALEARPEVTLTANSAMGARDYEEKFGLVPGSIGVIRNGLDVEALVKRRGPDGRERVRQELGIAPDEPLLGAVFRLVPAKRPHRWLEVAARVYAAQPKLKMLMVGEGPLRMELEAYAAQLGIGDRIFFAGRRAPVEPWIGAMDALLLSSDVEGLPNVLIEAQALGVPVVTTDAGGSREAVEPGVTGMVVATDTVEELAEACALYLTSEPLRARARERAPQLIAERFGVDRMVRETISAFGLADRVMLPA